MHVKGTDTGDESDEIMVSWTMIRDEQQEDDENQKQMMVLRC